MTGRPMVIDLTYVAARLGAATPTGIERVDAAFASHFTAPGREPPPGAALAVHYGLTAPHRLGAASARALVAEAGAVWRPAKGTDEDPVFAALQRWLAGPPTPLRAAPKRARPSLARQARRLRWRLAHDAGAAIPQGAIYLNVAQYAFEYPVVMRWLASRPDIRPVFFIHDLLPLDHPEFFRAGYQTLFERRVITMARFAHAAIVSSDAVGDRVAQEMRRRGRSDMPIFVGALPPPAETRDAAPLAAATPYFVVIGTIEGRKNHGLLLHAWRRLADDGQPVPRLVIVGPRGWENEQTLDLLDRSPAIRPHVAEVSGLSTEALARVIRGARAVLLPSFAEGYGLPLAEALAAGVPAIASDIPVFREVSQGSAVLLDPTDGPAWRDTVRRFAAPSSPDRRSAETSAARYRAPEWPAYFAKLEVWLASL